MTQRLLLQSLVIGFCLVFAACMPASPPVGGVADDQAPRATPTQAIGVVSTPIADAPTDPPPGLAPTWPELRNLTYPSSLVTNGLAPLQDGVYRARAGADGGVRELLISLGDLAVFADLNGDTVTDAAVLLVEALGGGDLRLNLVVVVRENGQLRPVAVATLGAGVFIEALSAAEGDLIVHARRPASGDALCCPSIQAMVRLQLRDERLVVVERTELPRRAPALPDPATLTPISLEAPRGNGRVGVDGLVGPGAADAYRLRAGVGQQLRVDAESAGGAAFLGIVGPDGAPLSAVDLRVRAWEGRLPAGGDYLIYVGADANTTYKLNVELVAPPAIGPLRPQPGAERVVYLTFDDGPHPIYTPQVLELLARYNARATFFVLGRSAEAHPALVNAISAAGHTLANHTYSHPPLAGIGREAFMREVAGAQAILGGAASRCFRPPYGSLDASTYAYAAELGLQVVLWDVDPQDWALPGAGAIAARVLAATGPGSIVLFHDGGGERGQTVAALAIILAELSAQGYRFEALQC